MKSNENAIGSYNIRLISVRWWT